MNNSNSNKYIHTVEPVQNWNSTTLIQTFPRYIRQLSHEYYFNQQYNELNKQVISNEIKDKMNES